MTDSDENKKLALLEQFTQRFLFDKLGMAHSVWSEHNPKKILGFSWQTDVFDMAKPGQLMLRGGIWNGERLLASEWIYRMTHPSFEDANTGYGYLTWLNSSAGWSIGLTSLPGGVEVPELPGIGAINPGPCAPVSIHDHYKHGLSVLFVEYTFGKRVSCHPVHSRCLRLIRSTARAYCYPL